MSLPPQRPNTIARSLAIGNPADGPYVLDELRANGGDCGSVPDDEILECIELLARTEGIFAETAGGVTIASYARCSSAARLIATSQSSRSSRVTDSRLSTPLSTTATVSATISPSLESAEEALRFHELVAAS